MTKIFTYKTRLTNRGIMIQENQKAPLFSSKNQKNDIVNLDVYSGRKNVILYFYPKDDTPGCTIEANDFTGFIAEFDKQDTVILRVSRDSCASHVDFIKKYGLKFDLLADTSGEICEKYFVWQEKEKDGIRKMGIVRSTFIIDKSGKVVYAEYGVDPRGHAEKMLSRVKSLNGN